MAITDQTSASISKLTVLGRQALARQLVPSEAFGFELAGFRIGRGGFNPLNPIQTTAIDTALTQLVDPVFPRATPAYGSITCAAPATYAVVYLDVAAKASITDGHAFLLYDGTNLRVFEWDTNGAITGGRVRIDISTDTTAEDVKARAIAAINSVGADPLTLVASDGGGNRIILTHSTIGPETALLYLMHTGDGIKIYGRRGYISCIDVATLAGSADGGTFTIDDGIHAATVFEFDTDNAVVGGHVRVDLAAAVSMDDVRVAVMTAINGVGAALAVTASIGPDSNVALDHDGGGWITVDETVGTGTFAVAGVSTGTVGIVDGDTVTISDGDQQKTFEFDTDASVLGGNVQVDISVAVTADDVAGLLHTAVNGVGAGLLVTSTLAAPVLNLLNDTGTAAGAVAITSAVTDPDFTHTGMMGGDDGLHAFELVEIAIGPSTVVPVCRVDPADLDAHYGIGELGIYATVVRSADMAEIGTHFLFAVIHFPMQSLTGETTFVCRPPIAL